MNAWTTLGLKRTQDVAEIRRAYARKLKAIDVEADPGAFIELRRALEWALDQAASRAASAAEAPVEEEPAFDIPEAADLGVAPVTVEDVAPGDEAPATDQDERNARFIRLEGLLFSGDESAPDPDALAAAVREIVDHPEMQHVDHDRSVQFWLADLLHAALPRSEPVLAMVVDRFGWEQASGQIDQPWLFEALVEHRRGLELIREISCPGHRYHRAWSDLTRPEEKLGVTTMGLGDDVHQLLVLIRQQCPQAETLLAPHRVALWEEKFSRTGPWKPIPLLVVGAWILWVLFKVVAGVAPGGTPSNQPPPVAVAPTGLSATPAEDLDDLLEPMLGRSGLARLETGNAALHEKLVGAWQRSKEAGGRRSELNQTVRNLLNDAIAASLRGGSPSLQADFWGLHLDRLKWLRNDRVEGGGVACARFPPGGSGTHDFPEPLERRQQEILERTLLEPPPRQVERNETERFSIPDTLFQAGQGRSGLAESAFRDALLEGGTPAERCDARISLLEAAIDGPARQREAFLREMSLGL